jgi:hypothetical protein
MARQGAQTEVYATKNLEALLVQGSVRSNAGGAGRSHAGCGAAGGD